MVRAGTLRERITIQQVTMAQSASGAQTPTWATFATRWAQVMESRGREAFDLAQTEASQVVVFICRYVPNLTEQMRISYDSKTYRINSVVDLARRGRKHEITATVERK